MTTKAAALSVKDKTAARFDVVGERARARLLLVGAAVVIGWEVSRWFAAGWGGHWDGWDFAVFMRAATNLPAPYICHPGDACFLYSPVAAVLFSPFTALPFDVALAVWRILSIGALALALRGSGIVGVIALVLPAVSNDLMVGNVMTLATAAMVAVIRWPSVRTVALYAVLIAIIPKPQFLPVLAYGVWHVREAWRPVLVVGLAGVAMLLFFPGYLDAQQVSFGTVGSGDLALPEPWAKIGAVVLTGVGLRYHRVLGLASFAAAPYWWIYNAAPFGLAFVRARSEGSPREPARWTWSRRSSAPASGSR